MNLPSPRMKSAAIEWIDRFGRDRFRLLIVVLAGLGTMNILVRTATYGAAFTPYDSAHFLSTALNFLAGEGWRNFWSRPLVGWPPLFMLLLAAFGWVGIEPLAAGRWLNAIAFGLTILATGLYLRSHLWARWLGLAATATLATSLPMSHFAASFLTEPLFVLLTLLALMQLASFLQRGGRMPLLWGAVCTALAALTRYPGVVLIGVGVLLLLVRRAPPLAVRLKHAVVFGTVSSFPLARVLAHNWAVSRTLTGREDRTGQSLSDGLGQTVNVFRQWVIPPNALDGFGYLLWMAAGLVVAGGVIVVVSSRGLGMGGKAQPASPLFGLGPALPFGGFALAYLGFLVAVVPFTVDQGIDSRFLLPVYVPLLLVAVVLLDRFLSIEATGRRAAVRSVLASFVLLGALVHVGFSTYSNLRLTAKGYVAGFEWALNSSYWESSETLNYIRTHLREGRIYSNNPYLAWFWDRNAALGKHQELPSNRIHKLIPRIMRRTDGGGAHIVWFQNEKPWYEYDDMDIRCLPGVETMAELSDGVVFRATADEPFNAERHRTHKQRYVDQLLQQVGERVVRSDWDVYRTGRKLTYRKQPCAPADVQAKFVLRVIPVDPADLPASRQRYGYDNLGFYFDRRGVRRGDECMAIAQLPAYPIDRIRVGQWISAENRTVWEAEFEPSR